MYRAITQENNKIVPASCLDNILTFRENIEWNLHSFYDGKPVNEHTKKDFYRIVTSNVANKVYTTTDHLFISCKVDGYNIGYVSLDNSVRSNSNGHPLKDRLPKLCKAVNDFINILGRNCIIFFSESCRPSFDGSDRVNRQNEMSWFKIRRYIETACDIEYLVENANNNSYMSFGVSAFCTPGYMDNISALYRENILSEQPGSGCIGVKFNNGRVVWGIHIPLDFRGVDTDNQAYKAMLNLVDIMRCNRNSIAIGDFNTISGRISDCINKAIPEDMQFNIENRLSFFGSYFDSFEDKDNEWLPLI